MKELAIVSGKGGTGKTSLSAAFAALAGQAVLVDADVDAANLAIIVEAEPSEGQAFMGSPLAEIDQQTCVACSLCIGYCRFHAIDVQGAGALAVDPWRCEGCGLCEGLCQFNAIRMRERQGGQWWSTSCAHGPFIHARLEPGAGNSGILVTRLREEARRRAEGLGLVLIDGPPGTGCPVNAAITGCDGVVIVSEASPSGLHDLERVLALARGLGRQVALVINRVGKLPEPLERMRRRAAALDLPILGEIPASPAFNSAQRLGRNVLFDADPMLRSSLHACWQQIGQHFSLPQGVLP